MNRTGLKERIAISGEFTNEERDFLLMAVNAMPEVEVEYHSPRNRMGRIEAMWAYLSVDEGGEGLCAAPMGLYTMPLIAADKKVADKLRPLAISVARTFGKPVRLARFSQREDREIIQP